MIEIFIAILAILCSMIGSLSAASMTRASGAFMEVFREKHPQRAARVARFLSPRSRESASMLAFDLICVILGASALYAWGILATPGISDDILAELSFFAALFLLKSVCKAFGERFANYILPYAETLLRILSITFSPLTFAVEFIARRISKPEQTEEESREEFDAMVKTAREEGALDDSEYRILKNIMRFNIVEVADVMTPRTVVFSCEASLTVGEAVNMPELQMYSRFPVWDGDSLDSVVGYVLTSNVLRAALQGKRKQTLRSLMREVYFIPENAALEHALEEFIRRRQHLFMVVDEYGGIEGLVTMENVVEMLLGVQIVDEADRVENLRELAKQRRDRRVNEILAKGRMYSEEIEQEAESEPTEQEE
ncbi:CNNM domain-containing protein [Ignavibacteria bacterium]|nr:CBS domain-containing protein [Bacteroidota bacterium]MCZ2133241.1 CBS domain-containing protein [Bacteroidota bacterium]